MEIVAAAVFTGPPRPLDQNLASAGTPYQIRDTDGTPITAAQGRAIVAARYRVSDDLRAARRTSHTKRGRAGDTRSRQALRHRPVHLSAGGAGGG